MNGLPKNDRSLGLWSKAHQLSQNGPVCELHSNWWLVDIQPVHKNLSYFISIVGGQNMTLRLTASNVEKVYKMNAKTLSKSTVKNMLYRKFMGNSATAHSLREESHAKEVFIEYIKGKGVLETSDFATASK